MHVIMGLAITNASTCLDINNACKCNNERPAWSALAFLAAHYLYNSIMLLHYTYYLFIEREIKYNDDYDYDMMQEN